MKHSQICIKCDSSNIVRIKGGNIWTGQVNYIPSTSMKKILVTRYLCVNCGYSEEWVDDPKGLEKLNKKYGGDHSGSQYV